MLKSIPTQLTNQANQSKQIRTKSRKLKAHLALK